MIKNDNKNMNFPDIRVITRTLAQKSHFQLWELFFFLKILRNVPFWNFWCPWKGCTLYGNSHSYGKAMTKVIRWKDFSRELEAWVYDRLRFFFQVDLNSLKVSPPVHTYGTYLPSRSTVNRHWLMSTPSTLPWQNINSHRRSMSTAGVWTHLYVVSTCIVDQPSIDSRLVDCKKIIFCTFFLTGIQKWRWPNSQA